MPDVDTAPLSLGLERIPKRIRVVNETGHPNDTNVYDADTGAQVLGAFAVIVERDRMRLQVSLHWPTTPADLVVLDPGYSGPSRQGIKTAELEYPILKLNVETM